MKLLTLDIERFRLHAATHIEFSDGVTGLVAPNGAGKSTVLEAIAWCLFGARALRGSKGSIRWARAPKSRPASATLTFELRGQAYRLERYESNAKLFALGGACLAEGTTAVDEYVPTLLGMGLQEWSASFMCGQKDIARLSAMKGTERVAFIRRMLGLDRIDAAHKAIRTEKGALATELDGLMAGLGERSPLEAAGDEALRTLDVALQVVAFSRATVQRATVDHRDATHRVTASLSLKTQYDKAVRARDTARAERDRAAAEARRIAADLQVQQAAAVLVAGTDLSALSPLRAERDALVQARAAASELAAAERRIEELEQEIAALHESIADAERTVARYDATAHAAAAAASQAAADQYSEIRGARLSQREIRAAELGRCQAEWLRANERMDALEAAGDGDCPVCARPLGEHVAAVLASYRKDAEAAAAGERQARIEMIELSEPSDDEAEAEVTAEQAQAEAERYATLRHDAEFADRDLTLARNGLTQALTRLGTAEASPAFGRTARFDPARFQEVEREIARLERLDRELASARGLAALVPATTERYETAQRAAVLAEQAAADAETVLEGSPFDPQEHARLETAAATAQEAATAARVALGRAEEAERAARARLDQATAALADYDRRAERAASVRARHMTHARADEKMGAFRVAVAGRIRPELEELTSGLVHLLTDGRHEAVSLSEDFELTLYESGVPVEVASGGTEDIAALALRIALSQLITQRAGHDLGLLLLDEVFGSLDEARRANVLGMLARLRGVFPQIIQVSHVAETRDQVDHVIELEFCEAEGCSRVVGGVTETVTAEVA